MTQAQRVSLVPDDFIESGATPPGRYFTQGVKFIDTFDYNGQQDKQTAAEFTLLDTGGVQFTVNWSVGAKNRIWPTADGSGLEGAPLTKGSNCGKGLGQAVLSGLPANKLQDNNIGAAFDGVWADWDEFITGTTPNSRGDMPKILVPVKMYLDGATPAAPVAQAAAPAAPVAPAPVAAPPPPLVPAPVTAPQGAPPPPPTAPAAAPEAPAFDITTFYPDMIRVAQEMVATEGVQHTRQQLSVELFSKLNGSDGQPADPVQKAAALTALFEAPFTAAMAAAGLTLAGDVIS